MTAGFPTDDPWGDRQQGLPLDESASFLSGGMNWAPGTRFQSNLGYAILGHRHHRHRAHRTQTDPPPPAAPARHKRARTGFEAEEFETPGQRGTEAPGIAHGTGPRRSGGPRWPSTRSTRTPMGGIFSCLRDLAHFGGHRQRVRRGKPAGRRGASGAAHHPAGSALPGG